MTDSVIRNAPVVQLHSWVNVKCVAGQTQELECCVTFPYKVTWFQDKTILYSSMYKVNADVTSVIKQIITALLSVPSCDPQTEILLHKAYSPVRKLQCNAN